MPVAAEELATTTLPAGLVDAAQPIILRGLVADWPAAAAGRAGATSMLDYLRGLARDTNVLAFRCDADSAGRVFYDREMRGFNFERTTCPLPALLDELQGDADADGALTVAPGDASSGLLYLGSTPVEECFPGFRAANDIDLGDAAPAVSIWMGGRSRIAAHFDAPENIACVVAGRRRFTLFPPEQLPNLYIGPLDFTPAGQAISLVDLAAPDFERFPRFREALDAAIVAELNPGDALYLPSMWWHHVEGLECLNVLINYWWSPGRQATGNPLNALVHALMTIRGLSPAQREAWRGLFEHYVFSDDADLSHIPEHRLGVLGEIDPDMARQLRAMLRSKLGGSG